jgi:hypothetical protein
MWTTSSFQPRITPHWGRPMGDGTAQCAQSSNASRLNVSLSSCSEAASQICFTESRRSFTGTLSSAAMARMRSTISEASRGITAFLPTVRREALAARLPKSLNTADACANSEWPCRFESPR